MPADRPRAGLTISEAARRRGVSTRAIEKGLASGRYARLRDGSIDPASLSGPPDRGPASQGPDLARTRATHEVLKARLTKLELDEREGRLINAEVAASLWFRKVRAVRDRLLDLPAKTCAPLSGMDDPAAIRVLLDRELRQVLEELTDEPPSQTD